ncbi:MAG: tandem-95 repeat protein, partial [Clostridia bacterium]|nr:tandem-95 repeat protein [Clostridia bacterium]
MGANNHSFKSKVVASTLSMLLVSECLLPSVHSFVYADSTVKQFNEELTLATRNNWAGSSGIGFESKGIRLSKSGAVNTAESLISLKDEDLIQAIDLGLNVPIGLSYLITPSIPENLSEISQEHPINVSLSVVFAPNAGEIFDVVPDESNIVTKSFTSLDEASRIDLTSFIPAGTREVLVTISVDIPEELEGASILFSDSNTKIFDNDTPEVIATYNTTPTNKPIEVTITSKDNIGVKALFDEEGNEIEEGYKFTVNPDDENKTYSFYAVDYAGLGEKSLFTFTIDNFDVIPPADFVLDYSDAWTNHQNVVNLPAIVDDGGSSYSYYVSMNGGEYSPVDGTVFVSSVLGENEFAFKAVDVATNESNTVSATLRFDDQDPEVNIEKMMETGSIRVNVNATDSISSIYKIYYVEGTVTDETYFTSGEHEVNDITDTKTFTSSAAGNYTVCVIDQAGNVSLVPVGVTVAPVIGDVEPFSMIEDEPVVENRTVIISVTDDAPIDEAQYWVTDYDTNIITDASIHVDAIKNEVSITFNLKGDAYGETPVILHVTDHDGEQATKEFTVNVIPDNDPPVVNNFPMTSTEGNVITVDLTGHYSDIDSDDLVVFDVSQPTVGKVEWEEGSNTFTFVPPTDNWYGSEEIYYTIYDGEHKVVGTVTCVIDNDESDPIANDDSAKTVEGSSKEIDVLANDVDFDVLDGDYKDELTIVAINGVDFTGEAVVDKGKVVLTDDKTLMFYPDEYKNGKVEFTYTVEDSTGRTSTATVKVEIEPVNDAPVVTNVPSKITISEDTKASDNIYSISVSDPDNTIGELMCVIYFSDNNIILNKNIVASKKDGTIEFSIEPTPDMFGTGTLTVQISDGVNLKTIEIPLEVVNVNDPPVAVKDDYPWKNIYENRTRVVDLKDILINDTDIDKDELFVSSITDVSSNVSITLSDDGKTATITTYRDVTGEASFYYTASDGHENGTSEKVKVTFNILEVNDAPTIEASADNIYYCDEDFHSEELIFTVDDTDTDLSDLLFSVTSNNPKIISQTPDHVIITKIDDSTYSVKLVPLAEMNGKVNITVTVSDGVLSDSVSFEFEVISQEDPPVAVNDVVTVGAGETVYILPITNDYDNDGEKFTIDIDSVTKPLIGELDIENCDGVGFYYTAPNVKDVTSFTYKVTDGKELSNSATVIINIVDPIDYNHAPEANDDSFTMFVDEKVFVLPMENDTDSDEDIIFVESITNPEAGTLEESGLGYVFTAPSEPGTYTVTYVVSDRIASSEPATITFTVKELPESMPVIDAPEAITVQYNIKDYEFTFDVNVTGEIPLANVVMVADEGDDYLNNVSVRYDEATGKYIGVFSVSDNVSGNFNLTITATDEAGTSARSLVTITVQEMNNTPECTDFSVTIDEDTNAVISLEEILAHCSDLDKDDVLSLASIEIFSGTTGTGFVSQDEGGIVYHSEANSNTPVVLKYTVSDGKSVSSEGEITINYNPLNDKPYCLGNWYTLPNEVGEKKEIPIDNLLKSCHDVDGDTIYFVDYSDRRTANGTLVLNNGVFTYTRTNKIDDPSNPNAYDYFEYYISDVDPDSPDFSDSDIVGPITVYIYEAFPHLSSSYNQYNNQFHTDEEVDLPLTLTVGKTADLNDCKTTLTIDESSLKYGTVEILDDTNIYDNKVNIIYHPNEDECDVKESITFTFSCEQPQEDGTTKVYTSKSTIYVRIIPVNDPPEMTVEVVNSGNPSADSGLVWQAEENQSVDFIVTISDVDNEELAFSVYSVNEDEEEPVIVNSGITVTPIEGDDKHLSVHADFIAERGGNVTIYFVVSDGMEKAMYPAVGYVQQIDSVPVISEFSLTTAEDTSVDAYLIRYITDEDTPIEDLRFELVTDDENNYPSNGTANISDTGYLVYTPGFNFYGTDYVTYKVYNKDNPSSYTISTVEIEVTPVNDAPYIYDAPSLVVDKEDETTTITFKAFDYDNENKDLTYKLVSSNENIIASIDELDVTCGDGDLKSFDIKPLKDMFGQLTLTLYVYDNVADDSYAKVTIPVTISSENDLPEGKPDTIVVDENDSVTINLFDNDTDVEDDYDKYNLLKVISIEKPALGTFKYLGKGVVLFTPYLDMNGEETVTYVLGDSDGGITQDVEIKITVNPVNSNPEVKDFEISVLEKKTQSIDLLEGATDVELTLGENVTPLKVTSVAAVDTLPEGATYSLEDNMFIFNAPKQVNSEETYEFNYTVVDGDNGSATGKIFVTIIPVSDAPEVSDDPDNNRIEITGGTSWVFLEDTEGVFVIDIDDPDTDIEDMLVSIKHNGSKYVQNITIVTDENDNKKVTIYPIENEFGTFTLTVTVSDGTDTVTEDFIVTILPDNDIPEFVFDKNKTNFSIDCIEDSKTNTLKVNATDVETAKSDLIYSVSSQAENGTATFVKIDEKGVAIFDYVPNNDYFGPDAFTIMVDDGEGGTKTTVVTVNVTNTNDAPEAEDSEAIISERQSEEIVYELIDLSDYISDKDIDAGDELHIISASIVSGVGEVIPEREDNALTITYIPVRYSNLPVRIEYVVEDSSHETTKAYIDVKITPVNTPPFGGADGYNIKEDAALASYDVVINDDIDTDSTLNQTEVISSQKATLTLESIVDSSNAHAKDLYIYNNKLYYAPEKDYYGQATVVYSVFDGEYSNEVTVTFNIAAENDPPTIAIAAVNGNSVTTTEPVEFEMPEDDKTQVVSFYIDDVETDISDLKISISSTNKALFDTSKFIVSDPVLQPDGRGLINVTLIPKQDAVGYSTITVTVTDIDSKPLSASASFKVTVNDENDDPNPMLFETSTDENSTIVVDCLKEDDVDVMFEGDTLKIKKDSITFERELSTSDFTGDISVIEDVLHKDEEYITASGDIGYHDAVRDCIQIIPDKDWKYDTDEPQTYYFSYVIYDKDSIEVPAVGMLKVVINPVNDKPGIVAADENPSLDEDFDANSIVTTFTLSDEETDIMDLDVKVISVVEDENNTTPDTALIKDYHINQNLDGTWTLYATPNDDEHGIVTFTVEVSDGTDKSTVDVVLTVNSVPDAPRNGNDDAETQEDTDVIIDVTKNDDVDTRTDGETIHLTGIVSQPLHGEAKLTDDGKKVIYHPELNYNNTMETRDSFVYHVIDDNGHEADFTVFVHVTPVNDPPKIDVEPTVISTVECQPFASFYVYVTDVDNEYDEFTIKFSSLNPLVVMDSGKFCGITISDPVEVGPGKAQYVVNVVPFKDYNGSTELTFYALDLDNDQSNKDTVICSVGLVNDPPQPAPNSYPLTEGKSTYFDVLDNDGDPDTITNGDDEFLTIASVSFDEDWMNEIAELVIVNNGKLVQYNVKEGYEDWFGTLTFTYVVEDNILRNPAVGEPVVNSVTQPGNVITVSNVNDAPTADDKTVNLTETDEEVVADPV